MNAQYRRAPCPSLRPAGMNGANAATPSHAFDPSAMSLTSGYDIEPPGEPFLKPVIAIRRSASATGSGRKRAKLTMLKTVEQAPMPSAADRIATAAKPGSRRSPRAPYRRSCQKSDT